MAASKIVYKTAEGVKHEIVMGGGSSKLDFIYHCNGVNDNEILSQMSKDFFNDTELPDTASKKIYVVGNVGETGNYIYGNIMSSTNPSSDWELGVKDYSVNRKLTLDFSNAQFSKITRETSTSVSSQPCYIARIKLDSNITMLNCNIDFNANVIVNATPALVSIYGFYGYGIYIDCSSKLLSYVSAGGDIGSYGFRILDGNCIRCTSVISANSSCYGFYGNVRYLDCTSSSTITGVNGYNSIAFYGHGYYVNCKGVGIHEGTGSSYAQAFNGNGYYVNCDGEGNATNAGYGQGFTGSGYYVNCKGLGLSTKSGAGPGAGYGFYGNGNGYYVNCTGSGTGVIMGGYGFYNSNVLSTYENCKGNGYSGSSSYGFYGSGNFNNCNGVGEGGSSYGFYSSEGYYVNCIGKGMGSTTACGFYSSLYLICTSCVAYALTTSGIGAFCFRNASTAVAAITYISGCTAALGTRSGYNSSPASVTGINLGESSNVQVYCKGNFIHNVFTSKIVAPSNVTDKVYVGENITTASITKAV